MLEPHTATPAPDALWPAFDGLCSASRLLLAVSGGPDSTAMMHLAAGWTRAVGGPPLAVACVDHGLRPESQAEAETVVAAAQALGLPAERLVWAGAKPTRGIAAEARRARYDLLTAQARRIGASHLVTGHTLDDQAETVLMRLARGTGVTGAAAMRPATDRDGLRLVRPLLGLTKALLVRLCRAQGWRFVDDPSNSDPGSPRVRWRRIAPMLAAEGLTAERLARFAGRAGRAEDALGQIAETARRAAALPPAGTAARLDFRLLDPHPDEIVLRAVATTLDHARGGDIARLERLETLVDTLRAAFAGRRAVRRTLGGCIVALGADGTLAIAPEARRRRGMGAAAPATSPGVAETPPFTLTGRSLGKGTPASYIAVRDATARGVDAVETHCASSGGGRFVLLSAGRQ